MIAQTERRLVHKTVELLAAAGEFDDGRSRSVGPAVARSPIHTVDAHAAVAELAARIAGGLRAARWTGPGPWSLLERALDLEEELRAHLAARRTRRREELERSLHRLRAEPATARLVSAVCEEAVLGCGMRRALLSRVRDGVWSPWANHEAGPTASAPWPARTAFAIEDLDLERTVIETSRPAIVVDSQHDPRVHPALRRLLGVNSYVVVPIAPNTTVVGLLHLDRGDDPRIADTDDEALAWAFAEGFGRVYERALMRERCDAQRSLIRSLASLTAEQAARLSTTVILEPDEQTEGAEPAEVSHARSPLMHATAQFTAREHEVLTLMLEGHPTPSSLICSSCPAPPSNPTCARSCARWVP